MSVDRGAAMAASLVRTARSHGVSAEDVDVLSRAHALAMVPRVASLPDDDHPLYLHPGRTVLVLLRDGGVGDPAVLAAAALTESEDAALRVDLSSIGGEVDNGILSLVEAVPPSGADDLAETLLGADEEVRLVAVAERLDHLRHAHLREDPAWRLRVHREAVAVYGPIAERTHDRLAGRYRYWIRMFARRFLPPTAPS